MTEKPTRPPTGAEMPTAYDPQSVEPARYRQWLEGGYFHAPDAGREAHPYAIMMPLPNITGELHIGHALNNTLQDVLIRFRRMQGRLAMWMPGTDHASIAVHVVIERQLAREGLTRHDLGRDAFIERVWRWREQVGTRIYGQLRRMGFSCDWDRVTFTMDPGYHDAVLEAFIRLHDKGLVYKGERVVSWCPKDQTTVSDLEIAQVETETQLHRVLYRFADGGPDEGIAIATQRPETILADTAVAVHPDDDRYRHAVGRTVIVPLVDRPVPVIADERVDPDFGTGALKITPGHDPLDHEIGVDHGLAVLSVIGPDARLTDDAGPFAGLDRFEARERVVQALRERGVLLGSEPYRTSLPHCDRCGTVIEPRVMDQWFARQAEMAKRAARVVEDGTVRFHPERWTKVFLDWMRVAHDWNISRQLWWGQRIPAWYGPDGEIVAAREQPGPGWRQEEDIFDTWFSSAIWPFATLGWPEDTAALRTFYPGDVLVTDRGIIFLWVARMIMFGLELRGEVPFHDVYINPTVLNLEGRRMSKSLGTGVDPLELVDRSGADSLRFALVARCTGEQDLRFDEKMVADTRTFANKVWNIARFTVLNVAGDGGAPTPPAAGLELADRWILSRYARLQSRVTAALDAFEFSVAARSLYDFLWGELADWYVEWIKEPLRDPGRDAAAQRATLGYVLERTMRLLHPVMPHLTEEVWQRLPHQGDSIMVADWPESRQEWVDPSAEAEFGSLIEVVQAIRSLKGVLGLGHDARVVLQAPAAAAEAAALALVAEHGATLRSLARVSELDVGGPPPARAVAATAGAVEVLVELGPDDVAKARQRLSSRLQAVDRALAKAEAKLATPGFRAHAPVEVVAAQQARRDASRAERDTLRRHLETLPRS
jgi:valyl-tRNA synthetase